MSSPPLSLTEVARLTGGRVLGDAEVEVRDVAPLHDGGPDDLVLLAERSYVAAVPESRAAAFLVSEALRETVDELDDGRPMVVVDDPRAALLPLLDRFHPPEDVEPGVHPTAVLGHGVSLGADVRIGPYAVIGDGVVLGDRARVEAHATVGRDARIGEECMLHPGVVIYPRTVLGRRVEIHAGARIGVDGFGYAQVDGAQRKIPQVGRVVLEDDVEVGANACVDRGSIGDTVVGKGTKIDNLVHVGHNVRIGPGCMLAGQVGIAGSVRVGRGVLLGGQAGLAGHLEVGDGARVSAQAGVVGDIEAGTTVTGFPAREAQTFFRGVALMFRLPEMRRQLRELERAVEALESRADGEASSQPEPDGEGG